jgi:hypothetical protein
LNLIMTSGVDGSKQRKSARVQYSTRPDDSSSLLTEYDSSSMRVCTCRVYSMKVLCISPP